MAQPYVGEIRMFAGNFAPAGWMFCEGQLLPISENETLFQLLGTTFGGDGQSTFSLPDLRGRLPVHAGSGDGLSPRIFAETGGVEEVTLTLNQLPSHNHALLGTNELASTANPQSNVVARSTTVDGYIKNDDVNQSLNLDSLTQTGGSQGHTNMMPYLCVNFIISLYGIFPSPT